MRRRADASPAHALLQLDRLAGPLKTASEAVAGGDVKAIPSLLRTLKAIDSYQKAALAHESYADRMTDKAGEQTRQAPHHGRRQNQQRAAPARGLLDFSYCS